MDRHNQILTAMEPGKDYRSDDFDGVSKQIASRVLNSMAKGGVIEKQRDRDDGRRFVFQTKQQALI